MNIYTIYFWHSKKMLQLHQCVYNDYLDEYDYGWFSHYLMHLKYRYRIWSLSKSLSLMQNEKSKSIVFCFDKLYHQKSKHD